MIKCVRINDLTFSYPHTHTPIFEHLTLQFDKGFSGIVGANGSGKTTLSKLISGDLTAREGTIAKSFCVYCAQRMDEQPDIEALLSSPEAYKLKELFLIDEILTRDWDTLSFGEKKRVQVAAALLQNPDVLILDEPSNHMDTLNREKLIKELASFEGIGILISHDRELLDTLCHTTIFLEDGEATIFHTSYSAAKEELDRQKSYAKNELEKTTKNVKKIQKQVNEVKKKVEASSFRLSKKNLGKDKDAKERINRAILTAKDSIDGRTLGRAQTKLTKERDKLSDVKREFTHTIAYQHTIYPNMFPITLKEHSKLIEQGDKIGIVGANGSGKSSFICSFIARYVKDESRILYIPQEISEAESGRLLCEIKELNNEELGAIMSLIVRLGSEPKTLLESRTPSPGETRKLMLALGLLRKPAMIILDEPTNHLDILSIEALENALSNYDGAVILASHDRVFLSKTVKRIWRFEEMRIAAEEDVG